MFCAVQFDAKFATEGSKFVEFDFNKPENIPPELHGSFDFVVIDPPFITQEVWQQYAETTRVLLRSAGSKVLLTTIGTHQIVWKCLVLFSFAY